MTTTPEAPAKTLTQLVALEIRLEMVRQDMLQSKLARSIGKTEQWLSVRLRGKQPIDLNDLALIARGLGVQIHQLLPDPDAAAGAMRATMDRNSRPTERMIPAQRRPADNRPTGHPPAGSPPAMRRTARVPRPARP
jgi:transcriptional regulator with XRE-family HTH domain